MCSPAGLRQLHRKDEIHSRTEPRRALKHGVVMNNTSFAGSTSSPIGKRSNRHIAAQLRRCRNEHRRMNSSALILPRLFLRRAASQSTILHINVASAASFPSTVAFPSSLQKSPRQGARSFQSSTVLRHHRTLNRAPSTATKSNFSRGRELPATVAVRRSAPSIR